MTIQKWADIFFKLFSAEQGLIAIAATSLGVFVGFGGVPPLDKLFLPNLVFCLILYGLNAYNTIADAGIDAINKPYRPLQKGYLSKKEVFWIATLLYLVSLVIAYTIGSFFFYLSLVTAMLGILYSAPRIYLKKRLFIGSLTVCSIFALIMPLAGFMYVAGARNIPWILAVFSLLLSFPCAILKDFEDYKGDKKFKINTAPVFFGLETAKKITALLLLLPYLTVLILVGLGFLNSRFLIFSVLGYFAASLSFSLFKINSLGETRKILNYALILSIVSGLLFVVIYLSYSS